MPTWKWRKGPLPLPPLLKLSRVEACVWEKVCPHLLTAKERLEEEEKEEGDDEEEEKKKGNLRSEREREKKRKKRERLFSGTLVKRKG